MPVSIVVPVLNEASAIGPFLEALRQTTGPEADIIVVDGGSGDGTQGVLDASGIRWTSAPRGRGSQMNAGAALARHEHLLFLHADTILPADALPAIIAALRTRQWGRFDIELVGRHPGLAMVAALMNLRSRLTGIATGDQAMFMTRDAFTRAGGFPDIALMEDIAMSRALKRLGPPACLRPKVRSSGRCWDKHGLVRTILAMWRLRLAYWRGADPDDLARRYGYRPRHG